MKMIRLQSVFKDYIWGGNQLNSKFHKNSELEKTAESWELSVHPDGLSVILNDELKGIYLSEYIKSNPEVLGTGRKNDELPILIKLIDAEDKLSIQVHPNNEQAMRMEGQNGKTEMWYILDADENATIIFGVKDNTTKEQLKNAILENTVEELLDIVPSKTGDVFFVDAGTIHAIGKGNLIIEIQQNSNVTYRLYDYDRKDKNGHTRELHIDKGIEVSNTEKIIKRRIPECSDGARLIGSCEYFAVKELEINSQTQMECSDRSYQSLVVVEGTFRFLSEENDEILKAGETVFLPAGLGKYILCGNGKVLIVENPPKYYVEVESDGNKVTASVLDEQGVIYGSCKSNNRGTENKILEDVILCVEESVSESGLLWDDIEAVRIKELDIVSKEAETIGFSIVEYLERKLLKKVYFD